MRIGWRIPALRSRTASDGCFTPLNQREIDDLITLEEAVREWLKR